MSKREENRIHIYSESELTPIPAVTPEDLALDLADVYRDATATPSNGGEVEGYAQAAETWGPALIRRLHAAESEAARLRARVAELEADVQRWRVYGAIVEGKQP